MGKSLSEIKYCICVLTRGYKHKIQYSDLIRRNKAISHVLREEPINYEIVIFHEGNIDKEQQEYIKVKSKNNEIVFKSIESYFKRVKQDSHTLHSECCHQTALSDSFSDGYKTMCRFWIEGLFEQVQNYDYIIRIDEDCFMKQLPLHQITQRMAKHGSYFGTAISLKEDHPDVKVGFDSFVSNIYRKSGRTAPKMQEPIPNTNFLVINTLISKNPLFKEFVSKVIETNCIQINRWGDHIIWGAAISYIYGSNKIEHMDEVKYIHGSFGHGVNHKVSVLDKSRLFLNKALRYLLQKLN
tara:strand:+ start:4163 stop:5053 length:891 start_codon:yes stop_codon:yes gene_type:complete